MQKRVKYLKKISKILVPVTAILLTPIFSHAVELPNSTLPGAIDNTLEVTPKLPEHSGEIFRVPPLEDRPLGVDEGDRLFVKSISLRSAVDRPEAGISLKEVRELVENLRFMSQELDSELAEGFTKEELTHGAKLLRQLVDDPSQLDTSKEFIVETLVSEMRFKMRERWLTIGNLQQIADEVTRYYRSRGFILAQAYLPAQTVNNGKVVIQVIEGMIGKVIVNNNERYTDALIALPFAQNTGQPAYKFDIESKLLQLSDYPGLAVFGVFQPGKEVGTADFLLNVRQEKRHETELRLDNGGSRFTGEYRLHVSYTNNNITRSADSLNIRLMQSLDPADSLYGALKYQRPVLNRHNKLILEASRNAYEIGADQVGTNIDGRSDVLSMTWRHSFVRSRTANSYGNINIIRKNAELSGVAVNQTDELAIVSLEYGFDAFDFKYSGVDLGWLKISQGVDAFGANTDKSGRRGSDDSRAPVKFKKIEARIDRLQTISNEQSLLITIATQYSNDLLTSTEQMTLGGMGSVRAYPVSEYLVDSGYFFSLEWIIKAPGISKLPVSGTTWGQLLQYAIFFDAASGQRNDPLRNEIDSGIDSVSIRGIGFGVRLKVSGFTANLDIATALSDEDPSNGKNSQVLLKIDYKM